MTVHEMARRMAERAGSVQIWTRVGVELGVTNRIWLDERTLVDADVCRADLVELWLFQQRDGRRQWVRQGVQQRAWWGENRQARFDHEERERKEREPQNREWTARQAREERERRRVELEEERKRLEQERRAAELTQRLEDERRQRELRQELAEMSYACVAGDGGACVPLYWAPRTVKDVDLAAATAWASILEESWWDGMDRFIHAAETGLARLEEYHR